MLRRILLAAILAGGLAGLVVTAAQQYRVVPLILAAEVFENALPTPDESASAAHDPAAGAAEHDGDRAWAPADGAERLFYTALGNLLIGIGYGFVLVGAMALSGRRGGAREGAVWALAGFATFALAPAIGLPPELPGTEAAALLDRQIWWIATVVATAGGLALIVFGHARLIQAAGLVLLVAPHAIGAPEPEAFAPTVPAELGSAFAVASLVSAAVFWLVLGTAGGWLFRRLAPEPGRQPGLARP